MAEAQSNSHSLHHSLSHNLSHSQIRSDQITHSTSLTLTSQDFSLSTTPIVAAAKLRSTILLFFLLFGSLSHSFYLPGIAPRDFQSMFPYNPNPLLKICALFHSFTSHCLLSSIVFLWGFFIFYVFVVLFEFSLLYVE